MSTQPKSPIAPSEFIGQPNDFAFLAGGTWLVANRRLRERHVGSEDWITFEHTFQAWSMLDGLVSVDDNDFASSGFRGLTFRRLDIETKQWSIYWINSRNGRMDPPVVGGWNGDRGEFYGDDTDEGRPIHVRFIWERLGPDRARWAQDFALIGEGSGTDPKWERNWEMTMTRVRD